MTTPTNLTIDEAQAAFDACLETLHTTRRNYQAFRATLADLTAAQANTDDALAALGSAIQQSRPARGMQLRFAVPAAN